MHGQARKILVQYSLAERLDLHSLHGFKARRLSRKNKAANS